MKHLCTWDSRKRKSKDKVNALLFSKRMSSWGNLPLIIHKRISGNHMMSTLKIIPRPSPNRKEERIKQLTTIKVIPSMNNNVIKHNLYNNLVPSDIDAYTLEYIDFQKRSIWYFRSNSKAVGKITKISEENKH